MRDFLNLTRALSDESRLRILMFLRAGELCLCQILDILELAPSTVSKHMSVLYQAGLVRVRKQGRWRYFCLAGDEAPRHVKECLQWLAASLSEHETIIEDQKRSFALAKIPAEELCGASSVPRGALVVGSDAGRREPGE